MQKAREQYLLFRIRVFRDERAFGDLHREYFAPVTRFFLLKLPKREDAEDASSTLFLRLWNYLTTQKVEHVSGLIFTIARGMVAEFYRSQKQEMVPITEEAFESNDDQSASAELTLIREKIDALSAGDQELILLKHFEGLSLREIAVKTGRTENSTAVQLHRAMTKLRELL